jgi:hypothetical protein
MSKIHPHIIDNNSRWAFADYLAANAPQGTPRRLLRGVAAKGGFPDEMSVSAMRQYRDLALLVPKAERDSQVYLTGYRYLREHTPYKTASQMNGILAIVKRTLPENEMIGPADIKRVLDPDGPKLVRAGRHARAGQQI